MKNKDPRREAERQKSLQAARDNDVGARGTSRAGDKIHAYLTRRDIYGWLFLFAPERKKDHTREVVGIFFSLLVPLLFDNGVVNTYFFLIVGYFCNGMERF